MSDYLKNLQESVMIQHSFIRSGGDCITEVNLIEFNDGAIKSLQHLLGVYKKGLSRMTYDSVDRPRQLKKIERVEDKIDALEKAGREAAQVAKAAREAAATKAAEAAAKTKEALSTAKETVKDKAGAAVEKTKEVVSTAKETVKDKAGAAVDKVKEVGGDASEKVSGIASKVGEYVSQNPGTSAAIAAAAAAAITAGILAYKRFFSKGAQACKNAPDQKECMKDLKKKSMAARISTMNAGKVKCAGNPKCNAKIDAKATALKSKMDSI